MFNLFRGSSPETSLRRRPEEVQPRQRRIEDYGLDDRILLHAVLIGELHQIADLVDELRRRIE